MQCLVCGEKIEDVCFNKHINKEHKLTQKKYHTNYVSRFDLLTKELIPFENLEQYYTTFYLNKNNLKKHLTGLPIEDSARICKEMLVARKEYKKCIYALSQVECRSTNLPAPTLFDKLSLDYNTISKLAGLKERFNYDVELSFVNKKIQFACDTREQKPLDLDIKVTKKLDVGDYVSNYNPYKVYVERKSGPDFAATIGNDLSRFEREIIRALKDDKYLMVVCEEPLNDMLSYEYQHFARYSYIKSKFLFHRIRELIQKYTNVQFIFCNGRKHMCEVIKKIYLCEYNPRRIDWQYILDSNKISWNF